MCVKLSKNKFNFQKIQTWTTDPRPSSLTGPCHSQYPLCIQALAMLTLDSLFLACCPPSFMLLWAAFSSIVSHSRSEFQLRDHYPETSFYWPHYQGDHAPFPCCVRLCVFLMLCFSCSSECPSSALDCGDIENKAEVLVFMSPYITQCLTHSRKSNVSCVPEWLNSSY